MKRFLLRESDGCMMRWNASKGGGARGRRDHVTYHVEADDVRLDHGRRGGPLNSD